MFITISSSQAQSSDIYNTRIDFSETLDKGTYELVDFITPNTFYNLRSVDATQFTIFDAVDAPTLVSGLTEDGSYSAIALTAALQAILDNYWTAGTVVYNTEKQMFEITTTTANAAFTAWQITDTNTSIMYGLSANYTFVNGVTETGDRVQLNTLPFITINIQEDI